MLDSNSNKKLLGIKDPNITIQSVEEEKYHGERCLMVKATLYKEMKQCPFCHQVNENHSIIKNGKKGLKSYSTSLIIKILTFIYKSSVTVVAYVSPIGLPPLI